MLGKISRGYRNHSFGGALNVTLSYREDSLTPNAVRRFISSFVSALPKEAQ